MNTERAHSRDLGVRTYARTVLFLCVYLCFCASAMTTKATKVQFTAQEDDKLVQTVQVLAELTDSARRRKWDTREGFVSF